MRGDFEYDKGSYPYAAMYVDSGVSKVRDMRTLEIMVPYAVPTPVAIAAALRLNVAHHDKRSCVKLASYLTQPRWLVQLALEDSADLLTATQVQATLDAIKED